MAEAGNDGHGSGMIAGKETFLSRGGLWVVGQLILCAAVGLLGWFGRGAFDFLFQRRLGGALLLAAAALALAGVCSIRENLTAFPVPRGQGRLVTTGAFGWMRHPLYASLILASAGWTVWCGSWLAGVVGVSLALFLNAKASREEVFLRQKFPEYADYIRRVGRFGPRLRRPIE